MKLGVFLSEMSPTVEGYGDIAKALNFLKRNGIYGVQMSESELFDEALTKTVLCAELKIYAVHIPLLLTSRDESKRREEESHALQLLERMMAVGAERMVIVAAGGENTESDIASARDLAVEMISRILPKAVAAGITLALKNSPFEDRPCARAQDMRYILDKLPELGCIFDTGNYFALGEDVKDAFDLLRDRVVMIQAKDREGGGGVPSSFGKGSMGLYTLLADLSRTAGDIPTVIEKGAPIGQNELMLIATDLLCHMYAEKNVEEKLSQRQIPDALTFNNGKPVRTPQEFMKRREEIKKLLCEEEYGYIPPKPRHLRVELLSEDRKFSAGKAPLRRMMLHAECENGECSFPFCAVIPKNPGKYPAFIHINFRPEVPDRYMPSEELCDLGFAVFSFCYNDVTPDAEDGFSGGVAPVLSPRRRGASAPGKIAMWAWAAMRIMDYLQTLPEIDCDNVAVVGHSRLGKTALVAGGYDERFKYVISNCSGCSGAALTRQKIGETVADIVENFPRWFCPRYIENSTRFESRGYDQNFLLALSVPRHILIGSAEEDSWADPESEFLNLALTNRAYGIFGMKGLLHGGYSPKVGDVLSGGDSCYHVRGGLHYFSREDWLVYTAYIRAQMKKEEKTNRPES